MTLPAETLLASVETTRSSANSALNEGTRAELGQFMTPGPLAAYMASLFQDIGSQVRLLDAGAGVGSLTAAVLQEVLSRKIRPAKIEAVAYEIDSVMLPNLKKVMRTCKEVGRESDVCLDWKVIENDFIEEASRLLCSDICPETKTHRFNAAILNPPYCKIGAKSKERKLLRTLGIEVSNLYSAFVALAIELLEPGGELVAITPRSFCNGPYFRPFRQFLLGKTALKAVHVFESRKSAFSEDSVLQENVIFHVKKGERKGTVKVISSAGPGEKCHIREVPYGEVVNPNDPNLFIHLSLTEEDAVITRQMNSLPRSLEEIGLSVSTGRVVDYRAKELLRKNPSKETVPLVYPMHFEGGFVKWPILNGKKPNAILVGRQSQSLVIPNETYVLTKRFSSKEEKRRVVAVVLDPLKIPGKPQDIGIENHVNYFHSNGRGLPKYLAKGLALFLNSTLVDQFFRQFNGHTQVNASDLRSLRYPEVRTLVKMGRQFGKSLPTQERVDQILVDCFNQK